MRAAAVPKPTPEQLHAAWQERRRRDWPATFDEAMQHELYSRLVYMTALGQLLAAARAARRTQLLAEQRLPWPAGQPVHRPRQAGASRTTTHATPGPDRKRLAAGDIDDE